MSGKSNRNYYMASAVVVLGIVGTIFFLNNQNDKTISSVQGQSTYGALFVLFDVPEESGLYTVDPTTKKFDNTSGLYSVIVRDVETNTDITLSMQETPEGFVDAPQVYEKLLETMRRYETFDSLHGTVYLTRPVELEGGQTAIMNAKGTLLFAKPNKDLQPESWRKLFNSLIVH